jgi:hypothetical protein
LARWQTRLSLIFQRLTSAEAARTVELHVTSRRAKTRR